MDLLLPKVRVPVLLRPSYEVLNMAFGVGTGTSLFDKSRYRSHGAITTATWAAGLHGYCLDFEAANPDYVTIPAAYTQLNFMTEAFSLILRIKPESVAAEAMLLCRGAWTTDGFWCRYNAGGQLIFDTFQVAAVQQTLSGLLDIVAGNWYTVGLSRNGAVASWFLNGVDVTTAPGVHINPVTCARVALIGCDNTLAGRLFDGKIEFLRILRGIALSLSEHLAWHNALA